MRLHNKLRLCIDIQNPIAIPMMARTLNQVFGDAFVGDVGCSGWRVVGVVADVEPHVGTFSAVLVDGME